MLHRLTRSVFAAISSRLPRDRIPLEQSGADIPRRNQRHRDRSVGRGCSRRDSRSHRFCDGSFCTKPLPRAPVSTVSRTCHSAHTPSRSLSPDSKKSVINKRAGNGRRDLHVAGQAFVQAAGETVEVSASGLALDTTSTTQTTDIPESTVQDIPLNGRDFTQMIGLAPGFAGYALGGFGSVNGTRGNQVNWQIDGADNNDWWHNIPAVNQGGVENIAGVTLPIDSIAEFSLQTQSSAEVGRNPGGSVNLVTKSGTNTLHGSIYYYERNQALAESNPFNTLGDLPLENVQWGASLGGPFWKDHTFWFTNFEKQKFNIATGNSGLEPNQYYQAAAMQLLSDARRPGQSGYVRNCSRFCGLPTSSPERRRAPPVGGARIRIQLQRRGQDRSHVQLEAQHLRARLHGPGQSDGPGGNDRYQPLLL